MFKRSLFKSRLCALKPQIRPLRGYAPTPPGAFGGVHVLLPLGPGVRQRNQVFKCVRKRWKAFATGNSCFPLRTTTGQTVHNCEQKFPIANNNGVIYSQREPDCHLSSSIDKRRHLRAGLFFFHPIPCISEKIRIFAVRLRGGSFAKSAPGEVGEWLKPAVC